MNLQKKAVYPDAVHAVSICRFAWTFKKGKALVLKGIKFGLESGSNHSFARRNGYLNGNKTNRRIL